MTPRPSAAREALSRAFGAHGTDGVLVISRDLGETADGPDPTTARQMFPACGCPRCRTDHQCPGTHVLRADGEAQT